MPPPVASEPRDGGPTDEIEASLFADPIPGARYIQVGSVDRGVAVILAEGLRTRGFNGFIAPGAKNGVYRVLVGPLRTNAEYQRAKEAVDRMGVSTFTRQFDK
jgi:cell division septation protein DedD